MIPLVAYLLLFVVVGAGFILVHLLIGKLVRPNKPGEEKGSIYECGEPTIGSAWIQFDLRFYVVALLFVIFDVEVTFFFPWAEVFGKSNAIAAASKPETDAEWKQYGQLMAPLIPPTSDTNKALRVRYEHLDKNPLTEEEFKANQEKTHSLALLALWEIAVFFGVLLVGYAYLWRRGDLAWVRSTQAERPTGTPLPAPAPSVGQPLTGAGAGS